MKNIFGYIDDINVSDGDIKINLEDGTKLSSNFDLIIDINKKFFDKHQKLLNKFNFYNKIEYLKANLSNNFLIEFDNTYKIKNYNYSVSGDISESNFKLLKPVKNSYITEKVNEIYLSDFKVKTVVEPKIIQINGEGKYSFNNLNFSKINLENKIKDDLINLNLDFDYKNQLHRHNTLCQMFQVS